MGSLSIVSLAVVSTAAVLFLPSAVKDNSCHNLFRDGRTSIRSQLTADMKLTAEDWPRLRQMFVDFGVRYSLSFRSDENIRHGNVVWRRLNLCSESGVNIDAVDRPWLAHTRSPLADRGTSFGIYELKEGSDWSSLARELLEQIEMTWPHQTIFRGPEGQIIHMEDARRGRQ